MPEIVENLFPPGKLRPAFRNETAQREDLPERAAGEQHDQQDREQKAWNCVADNDDARGPYVELRAVAHRLADAERDRDEVAQQRHPDAKRDRYRQVLLDQLEHADIAEIALAEIEAQIVPHHQEEALVGRLVEAELLLQALDEGRVESLGAAVFRADVELRAGLQGAMGKIAAGRAGNTRRRAGIAAAQLSDDALHRTARSELNHDERRQHDAENRGDHEQN